MTLDGEPIELTAKEFDLLAVLAEEPGRAVPRQELFARVWDEWGQDYTQTYRISGQWTHNAPLGFVDKLDLLVYFNSVNTQADTYQLRSGTAGRVRQLGPNTREPGAEPCSVGWALLQPL